MKIFFVDYLLCLRPRGHFGIARSVRLPVPWRSCLCYRHAGCLQLSHRPPPEMCGLRTRPGTDVDPPRFLPPSNCHRRGSYRLTAPGAMSCWMCYRYWLTQTVSERRPQMPGRLLLFLSAARPTFTREQCSSASRQMVWKRSWRHTDSRGLAGQARVEFNGPERRRALSVTTPCLPTWDFSCQRYVRTRPGRSDRLLWSSVRYVMGLHHGRRRWL